MVRLWFSGQGTQQVSKLSDNIISKISMKDNQKEIIIVSGVYPPEPFVTAQMGESIAKELSKSNKVTVLCPPVSRPIGNVLPRINEQLPSLDVVTLPCYTCPESNVLGRLKESYSFGKATARYIADHHKDIGVIYANTKPTFGQYLLLLAAQKYKIPLVMHIQDIYPESLMSKLGKTGELLTPLLRVLDKKMMRKSTRILTISPSMKSRLMKTRGYSDEFVDIVYNWQDESLFENKFHPDSKGFTFMFAGSLNPTASLDVVIEAFALSGLKDSRLVLAGNGSYKTVCMDLAGNYPDSTIDFESINPESVAEVQAHADVLILPLKKGISMTALPSKLPAYMFSGKPIIACVERESDIATIISQANCGWVVSPENPKELALSMRRCFEMSKSELDEMGMRGRQYALEHFSKNRNLERICRIIASNCKS